MQLISINSEIVSFSQIQIGIVKAFEAQKIETQQ